MRDFLGNEKIVRNKPVFSIKNLFKKKNILKLSLKYSIDSINKIKFYNFFELNILENENFENLKIYKKEKRSCNK